jgi:Fe-S cluster biosynthesis and repair protein YggX
MTKRAQTVERWSDLVRIKGRYQRSVNLERDFEQDDWLGGYVVTGLGRHLIGRIAAGLGPEGGQRAWSITGPYGSGKSAFALFMSHLLGLQGHKPGRPARKLLADVDVELAGRIRGPRGCLREGGLCPVLATGERASLEMVLLGALANAVTAYWVGRGVKPDIVTDVIVARDRLAAGEVVTTKEVVKLFERVAKKVAESNQAGEGLLVVLDEAGKCLEHAAHLGGSGDISLLQELAEAANRSGDAPLVFVVVLHQAFEQYASKLGAARRNEWAKIQGRFEDLPFQEELDQLLKLIGLAFVRQPFPGNVTSHTVAAATEVANRLRNRDHEQRMRLAALLRLTAPLHPITSLALGPLFRSRLAQNERSLFAFLASSEPGGFQEFLHRERDKGAPLFYGIDDLYDYVVRILGARLFGHQGRHWAMVESALRRLPAESDHLHARLVKAIGMLSMLGEAVGLAADDETLALALSCEGPRGLARVRQALESLKASSLVVFRKYKRSFQLWEGSDIDVEALSKKAMAQLEHRGSVVAYLERLAPPRPHIARRHFLETGTLRFFEVHYVEGHELGENLPPTSSQADGFIYVAIPDGTREAREALEERIRTFRLPDKRPVVVAVPKDLAGMHEAAAELASLEWVQAQTPQLQEDAIARRELSGRMLETEQLLRTEILSLLNGSRQCTWYHKGKEIGIGSPRELTRRLSEICDEVYAQSPHVQNELVNRRNLSSSAAAARRNLLQAMVEHPHEERLGIEGCPPELSMYLSVLHELGLHRKMGTRWAFVAPDAGDDVQKIWDALKSALAKADGGRVSLRQLYSTLQAPPFGMKEGVLPILLVAFVLSLQDELAVYEDGTFVPNLTAAIIERWLRVADRFQLQHYQIAGERAPLLSRILQSLVGGKGDYRFSVVPLIRHFVRFMRELPDYSRNTRQVSERAQAVREAVLRAQEPAPLLFRDLPKALDMEAFAVDRPADEQKADAFIASLKGCLRELQVAYPSLLNMVERTLTSTFGLSREEFRPELVARSKRLLPVAVETQLKGFLVRSADESLDREGYLVSLATMLVGKPPESWHDRDLDQLRVASALIARKFHGLESLTVAGMPVDSPEGMQLLRLSITQSGAAEKEGVVALREADQIALVDLSARLRETLSSARDASPDLVLAALALLVGDLLKTREDRAQPVEASR